MLNLNLLNQIESKLPFLSVPRVSLKMPLLNATFKIIIMYNYYYLLLSKSESWSSSYLLLKAYSILCLVRGLEAFLIIGK